MKIILVIALFVFTIHALGTYGWPKRPDRKKAAETNASSDAHPPAP